MPLDVFCKGHGRHHRTFPLSLTTGVFSVGSIPDSHRFLASHPYSELHGSLKRWRTQKTKPIALSGLSSCVSFFYQGLPRLANYGHPSGAQKAFGGSRLQIFIFQFAIFNEQYSTPLIRSPRANPALLLPLISRAFPQATPACLPIPSTSRCSCERFRIRSAATPGSCERNGIRLVSSRRWFVRA